MPGLVYSKQADEMLNELDADSARALLTSRIHSALDLLEENLGAASCRRRRFDNIGAWGIPVSAKDEDWLILWEPYGDGSETLVSAIIPAP